MKRVYIFDLDGTLALNEHRQHFVRNGNKDWDAFFEACDKDEPNMPVINTLRNLRKYGGVEIWIWSGRSKSVLGKTMDWLWVHGIMDDRTFRYLGRDDNRFRMREEGDNTPDTDLKKSWLDQLDDIDRKRIVAVFDDRNSVVKMWRQEGISCFQVAEGDF